MSESTPPPCSVGSQNQRAVRAAVLLGRTHQRERSHRRRRAGELRARLLQHLHVDLVLEVRGRRADLAARARRTRRASARLRASGFSQISPRRRAPSRTAAAISSITSTRHEVGVEDRDDVDVGHHLPHARRTPAPRPSPRARTDAASSCGGVRDVSPATSTPRTLSSARRWNCAHESGADDAVAERLHRSALSRRTCSRAGRPATASARSHVVSRSTRRPCFGRRRAHAVISSSTCSASAPDARCGATGALRPDHVGEADAALLRQVRGQRARSRSTPRRRCA